MKRNYSIDAVKFVFSVIIVLYHLFHNNMQRCIGHTQIFKDIKPDMVCCGYIVECFLIIAGYYIYKSAIRENTSSIKNFVVARFVRLWPVYAFHLACICFWIGFKWEDVILNSSLLLCTGVSTEYRGIIWYIPPFFWCSILLFSILRLFELRRALLLVAALTYMAYVILINRPAGLDSRQVAYSCVSLGMLRVLGGLGIGVILGSIRDTFTLDMNHRTLRFVFLSVVELTCAFLLFRAFLAGKIFSNVMCYNIIFAIWFMCMLSGGGLVSRFLSVPIFAKLGKYCYSIYVMQQIGFWILRDTVWCNKELMEVHTGIMIGASVVFTVFLGILTYHLIEQPCINLHKRFFLK